MMNLFLTPAAIRAENNKQSLSNNMQTKIPQAVDDHSKESFNDRTRKSLLKINLFIKRLKWFNIFADPTTTDVKQSSEINKW